MFKLDKENAGDPLAVSIAAQDDLGSERYAVPCPPGQETEAKVRRLAAAQGLGVRSLGYFGNHPNTQYQFAFFAEAS